MKESTTTNKKLRQFRKKTVSAENTSLSISTYKNILNKNSNWQKKQRLKIKNKLKHSAQKSYENCNNNHQGSIKSQTKPSIIRKLKRNNLNKSNENTVEWNVSFVPRRKSSAAAVQLDSRADDISTRIKLEYKSKQEQVIKFDSESRGEDLKNHNEMPKTQHRLNNINCSAQNCACYNSVACNHTAQSSPDLDIRDKQNSIDLANSKKKIYRHDHHQTFLSNKTQLLRETLSTMQLQHHLSVQQQELIQQLQLVQRQYLIHQGFVKPLQLDFQTQLNSPSSPCNNVLRREHQQLHLQHQASNTLTKCHETYYETNYLLQQQQQQQQQQQIYMLHEANLKKPLNEYRQQRNQQQLFDVDVENKKKDSHLNASNNNINHNAVFDACDSKQFITIINTTSAQEEHKANEDHASRMDAECKSTLKDQQFRESEDGSLCGDFKHAIVECMDGHEPLLQPNTTHCASELLCSAAASCNSFEHCQRNTRSIDDGSNNSKIFHNHRYITRQQQQREKEQHGNAMDISSGNEDGNESTQIGSTIFPEDESMPPVTEDDIDFMSRVRSPTNEKLFSSKHATQNTLNVHKHFQQTQRSAQCLPPSSPNSSIGEHNNGNDSRNSAVNDIGEFTTWANPIEQVSNITDDINAYIHYQQRGAGGRSRSHSRSRCSSNSNENGSTDNGSDNRENVTRSTCPVNSAGTQMVDGATPPMALINVQHQGLQPSHKVETTQSSTIYHMVDPTVKNAILPLLRLDQQVQEHSQQQEHVAQMPSSLGPLLTLPPPPPILSPITTLSPTVPTKGIPSTMHATAAAAAAASHAQAPHHNAATAVAVAAAAAAAAAAAKGGCMSGAPMTPSFGGLLEAISGSCGGSNDTHRIDYNGSNATAGIHATNANSTKNIYSPKKYYHPLYAHGICRWPGCELALNDFVAFVK